MANNILRLVARMYPLVVQDVIAPCVWGLRKHTVIDMYKQFAQRTHLDIGAGPRPYVSFDKKVTIMDVNSQVLNLASEICPHRATHKGNLLYRNEYPQQMFGSVSCFNVMHCVSHEHKWERLFANAKHVLEDDGILFGSAVLDTHPLSWFLNSLRVFHNSDDSRIHRKGPVDSRCSNKSSCIKIRTQIEQYTKKLANKHRADLSGCCQALSQNNVLCS